jgi:hypothetical protein
MGSKNTGAKMKRKRMTAAELDAYCEAKGFKKIEQHGYVYYFDAARDKVVGMRKVK